MCRIARRLLFVLSAFLFGLGLIPGSLLAASGTPVPSATGLPDDFCTPEEIDAGLTGISEYPAYDVLVSPASAPGMDLYMVKVMLEPGTCVSYADHFLHDGAVVWLVESGQVEFDFQLIPGRPVPDLSLWRGNGDQESVSAFMQLKADDWVSADRAVHYSYRNSGQEPAVIMMTVLENRWVYTGAEFSPIGSGLFDCRGICRNSRR